MVNYNTENNINFYDELFKSLDDDTDDENIDTLCQITGTPLIDNFVTLECKHKFNYHALYTEIYRQKFVFKTYDYGSLSHDAKYKLRENNIDYYIRCPYCRNIQFTLLPYYEGLHFEKKYGINSIERPLSYKSEYPIKKYNDNYSFSKYGVFFTKGTKCCTDIINCNNMFVSLIPNTELSYCQFHYKKGLKQYKTHKIKEALAEKQKQKEEILNHRKKIFDEKNKERLEKGLPLLKNLPSIKKMVLTPLINVENIVLSGENIVPYIPTVDEETPETINNTVLQSNLCIAILKTGQNKGKQCSCKKVDGIDYCKRHKQ
jgi:hypothetical protein